MDSGNKKKGSQGEELRWPEEKEEGVIDEVEFSSFNVSEPHSVGVFDFPWMKDGKGLFALETDSRDLHEVFFSSLIKECSAEITFSWDSDWEDSWISEEEMDGKTAPEAVF